MQRPFPLMPAILFQLELLGHGFLVLGRRIVPTFALGTLQRDDFSSCARHRFLSWMFVEPSTRFELVTPSLPRTCSTPELRGQFVRRWPLTVGRSTSANGRRTTANEFGAGDGIRTRDQQLGRL